MGCGTLQPAFFDLAALEGYINDPDFKFEFGDDGFEFSTAPDSDYDCDDVLRVRQVRNGWPARPPDRFERVRVGRFSTVQGPFRRVLRHSW